MQPLPLLLAPALFFAPIALADDSNPSWQLVSSVETPDAKAPSGVFVEVSAGVYLESPYDRTLPDLDAFLDLIDDTLGDPTATGRETTTTTTTTTGPMGIKITCTKTVTTETTVSNGIHIKFDAGLVTSVVDSQVDCVATGPKPE